MNFEKYKPNVGYPERPKKPHLPPNDSHSPKSLREFADKAEAYEKEVEIYNKQLEAYHNEKAELLEQFKKDLFEDLGIQNNPKRHLLYDKAWDRGHSSGLYEIFSCAQDLVELID